ncbi:hypothetical protein NDA16_000010 [Ustilago loliicola]|nr:hypothetical protein NDA16_000010 [Ustilago loliicola]
MQAIVKQAQSQRTTSLVLLQTAWNLLLASYAEDEELRHITSGSVHSGRLDEQTRTCMAPTFNVVPFTICITNDDGSRKTARQLLAEATKASMVTLSHLETPLGALAVSGGMPFDTLFAVQRFDSSASHSKELLPATSWQSISYPVMSNDFSIMVEIWPDEMGEDGGMRLRLTYSELLLDEPAAVMLLEQYDDMLHRLMHEGESTSIEQLIHGDGVRTSALSICHGSLEESRETSSLSALFHSQFEAKANSNPDAIALEFYSGLESEAGGPAALQRWTYADLNARANRLARHLLAVTGTSTLRDQPIPICMERCAELYVAVLAILKAGGAWCPIDVQSPRARQLELIARTKSRILLVTPETSASLGLVETSGTANVLKVDGCDESLLRNLSDEDLEPTAEGSTLAYLIWTSGTTGAPKGVMIEHSAALTSMLALQLHVKPMNVDAPPRCLQFSAYTFDVFVQDLFWTWGLGGTVIAASRELVLGATAEVIQASQASHAHLTPAFAAGLPRSSCPSMTSVTFIGEKLTESVAADWTGSNANDHPDLGPIAVYNTYGPAEVTVVATLRRLEASDKLQSANVGTPMRSVSAFVCKSRAAPLQPCAKGTVGELVLAGPQVGRGYLDDAIKTETAFAYSPEWQKQLYYTGDYVRMLHDGTIEFIGRRDDLVKLGGIRVELSEISAALIVAQPTSNQDCADPQVHRAETMLLSRPDRPTKQVISFLACPDLASTQQQTSATDPAQLLLTSPEAVRLAQQTLQGVRNVLPPYMVPSVLLVLSSIPQTASAKIDRAKLQAAYASADLSVWAPSSGSSNLRLGEAGAEKDEIAGHLQQQIIAAVSEITATEVEDIGADSSLASVGLDSIRAIRLAAKLKQNGMAVNIHVVLASQTVRILVAKMLTLNDRANANGARSRQEDDEDAARAKHIGEELGRFDAEIRKLMSSSLLKGLGACYPCSPL